MPERNLQNFSTVLSLLQTVGHLLNQPDCNRVAKFLPQVKKMHMNLA